MAIRINSVIKMSTLKTTAKAKVDAAAEVARLQFITPGSGQSLVYELKRAEAIAYLADTNRVDADYVLMSERAARKGVTLLDVANEWLEQSNTLSAIAAAIERLREGSKDAIDGIADDANAQANANSIVNGIKWPAPTA